MSGGSLNYLCYKEAKDLFDYIPELESVEETMLSFNAGDIAKDVRRLIEYLKTAENRIAVLSDNLNDIFRAVEWHDSGDTGRNDVFEAIERYRSRNNSR